jgi:hypothetical protein
MSDIGNTRLDDERQIADTDVQLLIAELANLRGQHIPPIPWQQMQTNESDKSLRLIQSADGQYVAITSVPYYAYLIVLAANIGNELRVKNKRLEESNALIYDQSKIEVAEMRAVLKEAKLQLEYLDERHPTGTTPSVLARIRAVMGCNVGDGCEECLNAQPNFAIADAIVGMSL